MSNRKRENRHWLWGFAAGIVFTLVFGAILFPLFAQARSNGGPRGLTEEQTEKVEARYALAGQANVLKRHGDVDGAIILMKQLVADRGGSEFTIIRWLEEADRIEETLPYYRYIYGPRTGNSGTGGSIYDLAFLAQYANATEEYGDEEDRRIIQGILDAGRYPVRSEADELLVEVIKSALSVESSSD